VKVKSEVVTFSKSEGRKDDVIVNTLERTRVDGKDLSSQLLKCRKQPAKLSNIDCDDDVQEEVQDGGGEDGGSHGRTRFLKSNNQKSSEALLKSIGSRVVFSGMKGFWRMATDGHRKVSPMSFIFYNSYYPCGEFSQSNPIFSLT
jgi:hypothetical protein